MVRPASLLEPRRPKTFPAQTTHQEAKTTTTTSQDAKTRRESLQTWHQGVGCVGKRGHNNGWCGWESPRGGGDAQTQSVIKLPDIYTYTSYHQVAPTGPTDRCRPRRRQPGRVLEGENGEGRCSIEAHFYG